MHIFKNRAAAIRSYGNWVRCFISKPTAKFKLLCFPFAGGGINSYRSWANLFAGELEVNAVLLPGRESRITEPGISNALAVTNGVIEDLVKYCWKTPLVFFGHSMGSVLAMDAAWRLKMQYDWEPIAVFVSGRKPPHVQFGGEYHKAPDDIFIKELKRLNGTPDVIFEDEEMRQIVLPMLRSDYEILETYRIPSDLRLDCSIVTCASDQDSEVKPDEMHAWSELTSGRCEHRIFRGNHFYINERVRELTGCINDYLSDAALV